MLRIVVSRADDAEAVITTLIAPVIWSSESKTDSPKLKCLSLRYATLMSSFSCWYSVRPVMEIYGLFMYKKSSTNVDA